jgi:phosphopantothenoylcysteine decarboxylase/phosphopantothenate--cysteine ligase
MLQGKKILIGVCGSIAAYKAALLVRLLRKSGAEVQVIMTSAAHDFITSLTLATLSTRPVYTEFSSSQTGEWNNHVDLGMWADIMIIAPATANTMAKLANGICDNLLAATYLSARCPVLFAPAMDLDMYQHPATLSAINKLTSYGNHILDAAYGELASGLVGTGRMAEPEDIIQSIEASFQASADLQNKKVLITAGPTYEAIDPVRFIGNHSSGKMGIELARNAASRGAQVQLILGPVAKPPQDENIEVTSVVSAKEMSLAANNHFADQDIVILAAAVADYAPTEVAKEKIKKKSNHLILKLSKTSDIAKELGQVKTSQFTVGFALETENELENAKAKLAAKNLDLIVLNSLNDAGAGFGVGTNKINIIDKQNNVKEYELKDKVAVAKDIIDEIVLRIK